MINTRLFFKSLGVLVLIAVLDWLGIILYLHWEYWWFDVGLHFLGGLCVSLALLSLRNFKSKTDAGLIFMVLFGTLFIGILWEIYELYFNFTSLSDGTYYWFDTLSDLILDICGGFFGALYSLKFIEK